MNGERFSREKLDFALLESFDLMQRVLLDGKYVLCGEAAKCLKEDRPLDCDGLDFVIETRYIIPEVVSTLKVWATKDLDEKGFEWLVGGVPCRFKFIDNEYDYFKYADSRMYGPEVYKIPNQFAKYWEERDTIE
jgi:hypothetical protein